ncbi:MAG TPA: Gfo/Idh/MocA family oxidoreductase [Vicinamibacterales bacterium]|nr:Gfo/Idh/MocA family oxidoreductase [Vicinamibacterales bacterium]
MNRIALVGLGNAGFDIHLPALAGLPSVKVVGACDLDAARRERAAARHGVPVFDGFERMLAEARPDVVVIGTPPDTHADYCLKAIAAGAHVICEKPFVSSLAEADTVLAAATAAGRRVALNHEFREMPIFRALRDEAAKPETGALAFVQVWQLMDLPPWAEPGWRGQMVQRTLYEAGVHLVDFLMALFGEKPVSVQAATSSCGVRDEDTDAVALVTLEFSRGRLASVIQNRLCKGDTQYFEVRAEAANASLRASFGGRARISAGLYRSTTPHIRIERGISGMAWKEQGSRRTFLARNPKDPAVVATRFVIEKTLAAFADGTEPPASGADGRDVLEVIVAAYHSARTGRRVQMDDPTLEDLVGWKMGTPHSTL